MSDWCKIGDNYCAYGHRIRAVVYRDGDLWRNHIWVEGEGELERGEWLDREAAIRNSNGGMSRLSFNRRFEKDPPSPPGNCSDEDDDEDDDE